MTTFFQGGTAMQMLTGNDFIDEGPFTIDDIFALPEGQRAELIDGQIYDMATPNVCIRQSAFPSLELLPII